MLSGYLLWLLHPKYKAIGLSLAFQMGGASKYWNKASGDTMS